MDNNPYSLMHCCLNAHNMITCDDVHAQIYGEAILNWILLNKGLLYSKVMLLRC